MNRLSRVLEEFLADAAERTEVHFGRSAEKTAPPPQLNVELLVQRLDAQVRFNNRLIVAIFASYLAILATIMALVVVHHDDIRWVTAALGGNLLVLLGSGRFLRDVWREKHYADLLRAILPTLPAAEARKAVQSFYFETSSRRQAARTDRQLKPAG